MFSWFKPAPKVLGVYVIDYGSHYRVEFNYNNSYYSSVTHVKLDDSEPSKLKGYEGMTAGEAYLARKNSKKSANCSIHSIPLRESELITTPAHVEKVISNFIEYLTKNGYEWDKVARYDVTPVQFHEMRNRERMRLHR